jgi:hypothetical protein
MFGSLLRAFASTVNCFGDTTYVVRKWKGSCTAEVDDIVG